MQPLSSYSWNTHTHTHTVSFSVSLIRLRLSRDIINYYTVFTECIHVHAKLTSALLLASSNSLTSSAMTPGSMTSRAASPPAPSAGYPLDLEWSHSSPQPDRGTSISCCQVENTRHTIVTCMYSQLSQLWRAIRLKDILKVIELTFGSADLSQLLVQFSRTLSFPSRCNCK